MSFSIFGKNHATKLAKTKSKIDKDIKILYLIDKFVIIIFPNNFIDNEIY
jgi:hypothetical protein